MLFCLGPSPALKAGKIHFKKSSWAFSKVEVAGGGCSQLCPVPPGQGGPLKTNTVGCHPRAIQAQAAGQHSLVDSEDMTSLVCAFQWPLLWAPSPGAVGAERQGRPASHVCPYQSLHSGRVLLPRQDTSLDGVS